MGEKTMDLAADASVEAILTDELARETRALAAVVPVLRHLLSSDADALVSEAILAKVRGMILDLAAQVLTARAGHDPLIRGFDLIDPSARDHLAISLMTDEALLAFCHTLAAEGMIADRLQHRSGIDPVLSPLLQELIASQDAAVASLAMSALAAQSRFVQAQRRMELPLNELPAEFFHRLIAGGQMEANDNAALVGLQAIYDEANTRLGLLARLVGAMRGGVVAAFGLDHAGLALFASALALAVRQPRGTAVLACHEGQSLRLALMLRSGGAGAVAIERNILLVQPSERLPRGVDALTAEQAAVLLGGSSMMR